MEVKILTELEEDKFCWTPMWISEHKIDGFYIPFDSDDEMPSVNVYLSGVLFTFKQEKHLIKFLTNRYIDNG